MTLTLEMTFKLDFELKIKFENLNHEGTKSNPEEARSSIKQRTIKNHVKYWIGRSPGVGGNGNPLQYSCLENPMDSGAW